ncbi:alpha/beta hydrolase [Priestia taiwanensis]|uniref:Hydrolase n=1 Tax=Priestia taiwanensis TaxID=1347902 RepID=A0A917AUZ7_9BACI|nr:alpha/beta hydrolase [Priestia taiwanensis]MBM7364176.1 hypothetical protein [Priestia taiwanensis]GGE72240.1 hydrolase [Priestia taiwanensis]
MEITERYFLQDGQWCVIHLPERPSGFGILLLGDTQHHVENNTSFWLQHVGRKKILERLRITGYTIFSSNLNGRHYGSDEAVRLTKNLYHMVMKKETLNKQIHIIAEGMGALVAFELMKSMPQYIRSVSFIDPLLQLKDTIQREKKNKFFYKRLVKDLQKAYTLEEDDVMHMIEDKGYEQDTSSIPVQLFLSTHAKVDGKRHARIYEQVRRTQDKPIILLFYVPERKYECSTSICLFLKAYEKEY